MKVIVAGSRSVKSLRTVTIAIEDSGWADEITEIVSGGAPGVDELGEMWAEHRDIPVKQFLADWDNLKAPGAIVRTRRDGKKYNAKAGIDRNQQMAEYGDALIAIWNGASPGTANMILEAHKSGIRVFVKITP